MRATRRAVLASAMAAMLGALPARAEGLVRLALTPVFLDNDVLVTSRLRAALEAALGTPIEIVQRRTYGEVVGLLLDGSVDAAWLCGFPFLQHAAGLRILAAPVWRGRPLYRSYLIAGSDDAAAGLDDFVGGAHAFSDPDSNSGWLVTASDLARMGMTPDAFFARSIFCYGHRNVVRAVASGLARSGSVDGYVWEALSSVEPDLAKRTRVVTRSEWMGFPPFVAPAGAAGHLGEALLGLGASDAGREALALLQLDGFTPADASLYDGIRARMRDARRL